MGTRRRPSKQFLRRLRGIGEPVPLVVAAPVEPPNQAEKKPARFKRWCHYVFRGFEFIALIFVIPTAYVLVVDLEDRQTQRIAQAWQLVTQNAPGNSGKIQALEYLNSEDCVLSDDPTRWELFMSCGFSALFVPPKLKQPLPGIDLSSESHSSNVYLVGVELSGAVLKGANLSGAELEDANLSGAVFMDANLSRAELWRAILSGANLEEANLSGAYLGSANLSGAHLRDANLSGAVLVKADLSRAGLWRANLSGAVLVGANLSRADLWRANLSEAVLVKADLLGAVLQDADLSGAVLVKADLLGADLERANLSGAVLVKADLLGAVLESANLSGAVLERANLSGAVLERANLSGANFTAVTLSAAAPYRYPLNREMLMGESYNAFPWPMGAPSGGVYRKGSPPKIDPSLLVHFTAVGDDCTWVKGLRYVECVSVFRPFR